MEVNNTSHQNVHAIALAVKINFSVEKCCFQASTTKLKFDAVILLL